MSLSFCFSFPNPPSWTQQDAAPSNSYLPLLTLTERWICLLSYGFFCVWVTPPITLQLPTHPVLFNLLSTAPDPSSSLSLEQHFQATSIFIDQNQAEISSSQLQPPPKVPPAAVKIGAGSTPAQNSVVPGLGKRSNCPLSICKEGVALMGQFSPVLSLNIYIYNYYYYFGRGGTGFCFVFTAAIQSPEYWFSGTWKGFFTGLPCAREQQ